MCIEQCASAGRVMAGRWVLWNRLENAGAGCRAVTPVLHETRPSTPLRRAIRRPACTSSRRECSFLGVTGLAGLSERARKSPDVLVGLTCGACHAQGAEAWPRVR